MCPQKRKPENKGLPRRWRRRNNAYYYRVPPGDECYWEGKTEYPLGKSLHEAYKTFAKMIQFPDEITTMEELIRRYRKQVTPNKAPATQHGERPMLITLEQVLPATLSISSPRPIAISCTIT